MYTNSSQGMTGSGRACLRGKKKGLIISDQSFVYNHLP